MATLVSPGVSVTVIDQSFYIPASAPTVPLFFLATRANKMQPDNITPAAGTQESGIVRTITSIGQSVQMYGVPYFWADNSGNQFHGDARNEYGLFALNEFLGLGSTAYVVRANVDLTDASSTFLAITKVVGSQTVTTLAAGTVQQVSVGNGTIGSIAATLTNFRPEQITVVMNSPTAFTVTGSVSGIIATGTVGVAFTSNVLGFTVTAGGTPFSADDYFQFNLAATPTSYTGTGNGTMSSIAIDTGAVAETWSIVFTSPTAFSVTGSVSGATATGTVGAPYDNGKIAFVITAGTTPFVVNDEFQLTVSSITVTNPLGANDAAKRVAITTALAAQINSNTEVRSEIYEYNIIVCPGYPEVVEDLVALTVAINEEAFIIADTPNNLTPEQVVGWAATSARATSMDVAYYYPWGLGTNLDGTVVCVAPSGIALATYAYSDNQSYVWFAPAGVRRGTVVGISEVGYVSGTLGTATTFVQANLNQGQRDNLYQYFTNINPIVFFPDQGIIIWGQKTSYNAASALDRVNVVRLVMYMRRGLRKGAMPFCFEPNDAITQKELKAMADGFCNDIMAKRGLYDFVTQCNSANNPANVVAQNEMYLNVAIEPEIAAEFIYIPITVLTTGAALP
jgi:phage tail sheath protein FI